MIGWWIIAADDAVAGPWMLSATLSYKKAMIPLAYRISRIGPQDASVKKYYQSVMNDICQATTADD
jgi:hypothetical protein